MVLAPLRKRKTMSISSTFGNRLPFSVIISFWIGILVFLPRCATANDLKGTSPSAAHVLDQKKIHHVYTDGDFEGVIASIDSFTQANKTYSLSDSVFIAKHLAVIYTANPATREKGKNYMFRLLSLLPSAKIVDMFVSDEIDHIFEKIKEEYVVRQQSLGLEVPSRLESNQYAADKMTRKESPEAKSSPADGEKEKPKKGSSHSLYWVAGGVTLFAVAGAAAYFLYPKKTADKSYDLP